MSGIRTGSNGSSWRYPAEVARWHWTEAVDACAAVAIENSASLPQESGFSADTAIVLGRPRYRATTAAPAEC
jgi:hypothetical protein